MPQDLHDYIGRRANKEKRSITAVAAEMLRHAMLCQHKVTVTEEI